MKKPKRQAPPPQIITIIGLKDWLSNLVGLGYNVYNDCLYVHINTDEPFEVSIRFYAYYVPKHGYALDQKKVINQYKLSETEVVKYLDSPVDLEFFLLWLDNVVERIIDGLQHLHVELSGYRIDRELTKLWVQKSKIFTNERYIKRDTRLPVVICWFERSGYYNHHNFCYRH